MKYFEDNQNIFTETCNITQNNFKNIEFSLHWIAKIYEEIILDTTQNDYPRFYGDPDVCYRVINLRLPKTKENEFPNKSIRVVVNPYNFDTINELFCCPWNHKDLEPAKEQLIEDINDYKKFADYILENKRINCEQAIKYFKNFAERQDFEFYEVNNTPEKIGIRVIDTDFRFSIFQDHVEYYGILQFILSGDIKPLLCSCSRCHH